MTTSTYKKKHEKLSLLRSQINIWKKVLKRKIIIPFTHSRSQHPLDAIVASTANEPTSLIGKRVEHKFEHEDTHEAVVLWFCSWL